MRIGFISPKAGQGTTVVACATALALAENGDTAIVPSMDTWAALGLPEGATAASPTLSVNATPGLNTPNVVLDDQPGDVTYMVVRPCYMALRRAVAADMKADGIVLIEEPGRALTQRDVERALGIPVVAVITFDPAIARSVDAGLLACRQPAQLRTAARRVVEHAASLAKA